MKHLRRLLLSLLPLCFSGPGLAQAPAPSAETQLNWVAGDLPPFAWQSPGGPQGYAYELAIAMAKRLGRKPAVEFFPWARAVKLTAEGDSYGVFPLARTPDREALFRWLIPLVRVNYTFFARASSTEPNSFEQLRAAKVAVLRGSPIIKNLHAQYFRDVVEAKDYRDMLRLLNDGIVGAVYAGTPMLQAAMIEYGGRLSDYRAIATLGDAELYMGTSLKLDVAEGERWIAAYRELERDGTVARLQRKYLPSR